MSNGISLRLEYERGTQQLNLYADRASKSCGESRSDWELVRTLPMAAMVDALHALVTSEGCGVTVSTIV